MKNQQELVSDQLFYVRLLHTILILDVCLCVFWFVSVALAIIKHDQSTVWVRLAGLIGAGAITFSIALMQSHDNAASSVLLVGLAAMFGSVFLNPRNKSIKAPKATADSFSQRGEG